MTDKDISFDKYYTLDTNQMYFSIDLQRSVKFTGVLAIKPTHCSTCGTWFGKLVDVDLNGLKVYGTNNEIEFTAQNVVSEYEFKNKIAPDFFVYMPMDLI